jgi:malonyl CoA-acyl carrier protein transacylase
MDACLTMMDDSNCWCTYEQDLVAEVPAARDMFSRASAILGYDLLHICTDGACLFPQLTPVAHASPRSARTPSCKRPLHARHMVMRSSKKGCCCRARAYILPGTLSLGICCGCCMQLHWSPDRRSCRTRWLSASLLCTLVTSVTLCTGPKERLDSTAVSQPAIYVASLAAVEKLRQTEGQVRQSARAAALPAGCLGIVG